MTVRVGFLGAGLIASLHAYLLSTSGGDYALAGVYDPDEERARRFGADWHLPARATEAEVLDGCDAVYVCTWTSEHPRLVELAVGRGLAVFCEKPLATDLAGAARVAGLVRSAGVVNQVGLILRYSPAFALVRYLVRRPESGAVMNVTLRDDQYIPVQGMYGSTWRADRTRAGSGALLEHSIHDLDILEHLVGPMSSVSASTANFHGLDGIEDSVAVMMTFEGGAPGVLTSVWHDVLERPSQRHLEVFCERLYVELDDELAGPVTWQGADGDAGSLAGEALMAEVRRLGVDGGNPDGAFLDAVRTGGAASPDFDDALRAHVLADAVYRSADAGQVVVLPAR